MKIAHFGNFAPNRAGIYTMARDLILAERSVGMESNFIDYGSEEGATHSRVWLKDGEIETVSPEWAITDANILVHHSAIPQKVLATGKPVVFYLHGRPEYTAMMDWKKAGKHLAAHEAKFHNPQYKKFITFWESHLEQWSIMFPDAQLECVTPPIDLSKYSLDGKKCDLSEQDNGNPNILICDMWREDITPLNTILAAIRFAKIYCPTAKIHIAAVPFPKSDNSMDLLFHNFKKSGVVGKVVTIIKNIDELMRACDILVTPLGIETRTVLEASALGLAVVAGTGSLLSNFTSDPRDIVGTADAINNCWQDIKRRTTMKKDNRTEFETRYGLKITGEEIKTIYERVK